MGKKKLPIVAIVGRANVGKSSLFNAILDRREAIIADEPGTTRDSIMAKASIFSTKNAVESRKQKVESALTPEEKSLLHLNGILGDSEQRTESYTKYDEGVAQQSTTKSVKNVRRVASFAGKQANMVQQDFWIVDTAGLKDAKDEFEFTIQEQIIQAADSADFIVVMVEANTIVTEEDRRVARMALRSKKPVILIINKADKAHGKNLDHFERLGIKAIFATSVTQHHGIDELLNYFAEILPKASLIDDDDRIRIALLGRPNVGKSALFNALSKKQQAIVADRAGTTRDINRSIVRYNEREVEILDTAGIRRSGKIEPGIEKFSVIRSLSAIEQADICVLVIDANDLHVQLDQKIAGMIKEAGKGLILGISKWDSLESIQNDISLVPPEQETTPLTKREKKRLGSELSVGDDGGIVKTPFTRDTLALRIANDFDFVPWAPLIFTSSVTGQNVTRIFELALEIIAQRAKRLKTTELNRWLRRVTDRHPPAGLKNRAPKLNYITQETDNPIPAFKVFGSHTKFLHWSYKRHMDRKIREEYGYVGTPVQFWFIEKHVTHKHGVSPTKSDSSK